MIVLIDIIENKQSIYKITSSDSIYSHNQDIYQPGALINELNFSKTTNSSMFIDITLLRIFNIKIDQKIKINIILENGTTINNFYGYIFEITETKNEFIKIKCINFISKLFQKKGTFFTDTCKAEFCDDKCRLDKTQHSQHITIQAINQNSITTQEKIIPGIFSDGYIEFTSGYLKEKKYKIFNNTFSEITTNQNLFLAKSNDKAIITQGCQKTKENCKKFNNIKNFQGEMIK